jgi:formate dehydrogenase subunit delta
MESAHMVYMANQIATFFTSYPKAEAVDGVAAHLQSFWAPRMRKQIIQYVADGGGGLNDLVIEALKKLH